MKVEYQKFITRADMKANPNKLYIFGDNLARVGFGGQAKEMRGEPNAFGIATKRAPTYNPEDFFTDKDLHYVMADISSLLSLLHNVRGLDAVVVPQDGIGTGIARLKENAPNTLNFINTILFDFLPIYCAST